MQQDKTFLGTEPVGKLLWRLGVPTVIAQLVNMLYNIVDRIYIGHMPVDGSLALTGVGVCMPLILIVSAFSAFVASGGAPRASIAMGRGNDAEAEKILGGCFMLQAIISVILTAVMLLWSREMLLVFGASENTIGFAMDYMSIYALGTLFVQLTLGLNAFVTAQGFARTGMLTVLIGALVVAVMVLWPKKWGARVPGSLVGIVLATVAALLKLADAKTVVTRHIPWNTLMMLAGVSMLVGVASEGGAVDLIGSWIGGNVPTAIIVPMFVLLSGFMSVFSAGSSVVVPTLFVLVPSVLTTAVGVNYHALYAGIAIGANASAVSPSPDQARHPEGFSAFPGNHCISKADRLSSFI